jgi:hypothetical protein
MTTPSPTATDLVAQALETPAYPPLWRAVMSRGRVFLSPLDGAELR